LKQGKNLTPTFIVSLYDVPELAVPRLSSYSFVGGEPARPVRPEFDLSGTSLHQSLEGGASFGDLWEAGVRTFKMRKKFLVQCDRGEEGGGYLLKPQNPQTGPSPSVPRFDFSRELFRAQIHSFARV